MKTYYCPHLYNEINFDAENIYICCGMSLGPSHEVYNPEKWKSYDDFVKDLLKWRQNVSKQAFLGNIPEQCKNCLEIQKSDISPADYLKGKFFGKFPIKHIIIKPFRQCELSCVYCLEKKYTKGKTTTEVVKSEFYDFLPIFKKMVENKIIATEDVEICFQGGSISVWDEFDEVVDMAHKYGIKKYEFLANAYRFLPKIAEIAKDSQVNMTVSVDSGCRETFQKIKNADKFDEVMNNVIEYANSNVNMLLKYIVLRGINDNLDELKKFCNMVFDLTNRKGIKGGYAVMIDIDYRDILKPDYVMPEEHRELLRYISEWGKETKIDVVMQEHVRKMIDEK